jgi:hypothetical protein
MSDPKRKEQTPDPCASAPDHCAGDAQKSDYQVGYKRPPRQTRFKPGQSGNPKGRPKGTPNHSNTVNRVMNEKISVREGDKTRRMNKFEAILQAHAQKSMKGDARSAGMMVAVMGKAGLLTDGENVIRLGDAQAKASANLVTLGNALFVDIDEARLSKGELIDLSRLAEIVDRGGDITALSTSEFERLKEIINKGRGKNYAAA